MNEWSQTVNYNIQVYMSLINSFLLSKNGRYVTVNETLKTLPFTLPKGIKTKGYNKSGKYPIVSQSKDFISGYSDSDKNLIQDDLPLIIFGDHTKVIKYINFPFLVGADGVKLLKPIDDILPKYFYYSLISLPLDTKNYGRHFKILKESKIVFIKDLNMIGLITQRDLK